MAGVYLSFPFCAQKCTYCNFASGVFPEALEDRYLDALEREIGAHEWRWAPETVYIGGGTPSRLSPAHLDRLLDRIPGRPWLEATLEVAPGDVSREKADGWQQFGISRVSLGVQSFIRKELAQTGRRHTAEIVADEIDVLRSAGIDNINIDLIAGLPFQTRASFAESLDWVVRLGVPHVSVYMLEVDEDSRLGREMLLGGVRYGSLETPPDDVIVTMYEDAVRVLDAAGIPRYEISNFARPTFESRHNLKYWRLEEYAGFGADAHSLLGGRRRQNVESAAEYVERSSRGESVEGSVVEASPEEEKFFVGLRLAEGIRMDAGDWTRYGSVIGRQVEDGFLDRIGDRLRLTDRGVLFSNEVMQEFLHA